MSAGGPDAGSRGGVARGRSTLHSVAARNGPPPNPAIVLGVRLSARSDLVINRAGDVAQQLGFAQVELAPGVSRLW